MGLAGRKEKQKIGSDPRNLTWAQDNARFGQQYLAKFGWTPDSGSGLGANGDGRLAHISVAQKLNLLGIGNGPSGGVANTPDAIAWKQNKEFESVLKRLNGVEEEPEVKFEKALLHGFVKGEITESTIENEPKASTPEMLLGDDKTEKQRRKEERKRLKQERAEGRVETLQTAMPEQQAPGPSSFDAATQPKPGGMGARMAHRAKFRASKQLASVSSAALSEILGIAGSGSATPISSTQSAATVVPASNSGRVTSTGRDEQLTTSTTSVADYFAAKMKARREGTQFLSEPQNPLEVPSPSPGEHAQEEEIKTKEEKREKKRKRGVEVRQEDAMAVDEEEEETVDDEEPSKRRKEKGVKEKKKKRRKEA